MCPVCFCLFYPYYPVLMIYYKEASKIAALPSSTPSPSSKNIPSPAIEFQSSAPVPSCPAPPPSPPPPEPYRNPSMQSCMLSHYKLYVCPYSGPDPTSIYYLFYYYYFPIFCTIYIYVLLLYFFSFLFYNANYNSYVSSLSPHKSPYLCSSNSTASVLPKSCSMTPIYFLLTILSFSIRATHLWLHFSRPSLAPTSTLKSLKIFAGVYLRSSSAL